MSELYFPVPGHSSVCIGENYADVKLYQCNYNTADNNSVYGSYVVPASDGKGPGFVGKPIEDCPGPYFPSLYYRPKGVDDVKLEYLLYTRISRKVDDLLLEKPGNANLIYETVKYLLQNGETNEDAVTIIKTLLGESFFYKYKKLKSGEYI